MGWLKKALLMIVMALSNQPTERCILNTRIHFGQPLPIIIKDDKLLEPSESSGDVLLQRDDKLTISCEGQGFLNHPNANQQLATADIYCINDAVFRNEGWLSSPANFREFKCGDAPSHKSQRTNRTCFENNPIIEVGYTVQGRFYPVFETCFNENILSPIYSTYKQRPFNALYQQRVDRPYFIDNDNYRGINVDSLFRATGLENILRRLVGSAYGKKLSRGHLAAKTDFVYAFSERATFHYVNCAPQWESFNGGNWNTLEVDLRDHVHSAGYNTVIYTGVYGVTSLAQQDGDRVNLHLYTDKNNNPVIPVPKYFYKVVYEPDTMRGIAFVGINNPYLSLQEAQNLFFCEDVCRENREFHWLSWNPDNADEGYTFCCSVSEFRNTIHHLPEFEVRSLLT